MCADEVDVARDDQSKELLASPQRLGLDDGWLGHLPIPGRQPHQQLHHFFLVHTNNGKNSWHFVLNSTANKLNNDTRIMTQHHSHALYKCTVFTIGVEFPA